MCRPAKAAELRRPLETVDGWGWLGGDIRGRRVLCLAAGGGRHSVLYAAAGARVTVVDISPGMLALDHAESRRHGLNMRIVEASMRSFDSTKARAGALLSFSLMPRSCCTI